MVEAAPVPRSRLVLAGSLAVVSLFAAPGEARAVELGEVGGQAATVDVTNTAALSYHFDNRNGNANDDNYGELVDHLNLQANWWRLTLGLRVDSSLYFNTVSRGEARTRRNAELGELSPSDRNEVINGDLSDLHSRYLRTFYPAKLWIGYNQPGLDVTLGDFYAQLGRGLVLSLRKLDELGIDTTVRGAKVVVDHDFGPLRAGATLLGGVMNPSRLDEVSGRRLHGESSPLFFGFPRAGDFQTYRYDQGQPVLNTVPASVSYLDDRMLGGHLEAGNDDVQFGANGSLLLRTSYTAELASCVQACDPLDEGCTSRCSSQFPVFSSTNAARTHDTIRTFGGSVNIPSIAGHGDLYVEVVGQQLRDGHRKSEGTVEPDVSGYAVYVSGSFRSGPLTASFEGKHNRTFFPLSANVDITTAGFLAPEFDLVAYSQPPTAEPIYVEAIGSPNVCITGGRGRVDYRFSPTVTAYGWIGHYVSATELDQQNRECAARKSEDDGDKRTRTWDVAVGSELDFEQKKSHVRAWVGARTTDRFEPARGGSGSTAFYREGYLRYDIVKHLGGPFSLQAQGVHRRRHEPDAYDPPLPWTEGENYTALQWAPHFSFIFGYEYLARTGCRTNVDLCHYLSGGVQWRSGSSERFVERLFDTVSVFVGQRRGGIRCVAGTCKPFPPFEGARLEIVSRF